MNVDSNKEIDPIVLETADSFKGTPLELGKFFVRYIQENNLSSKEIQFLQTRFTQESANCKTGKDTFTKRLKRLYNISKSEEKMAQSSINTLFSGEKRTILNTLFEDKEITKERLIKRFRKLPSGPYAKLFLLVDQILKGKATLRKLKMRLFGNAHFSDQALRVTFVVSESPKETSRKIARFQIKEKTKVRTNIASMTGVSHLEKPSIKNLMQGVVPINESTLTSSLKPLIIDYLSKLGKTIQEVNEEIQCINEPAEVKVNEIVQKSLWIKNLSEAIFDDIPEEFYNLQTLWYYRTSVNSIRTKFNLRILQSKKRNLLPVNKLKNMPQITDNKTITKIEQILIDCIFKVMQQRNKRRISASNAKFILHEKIAKKAELNALSTNLQNELLKTALFYYFFLCDESVAVVNKAFS